MNDDRTEPAPLLRKLLELVAEQMELDRGRWRLELAFHDGRLRECYRHEGPLPVGALARYETGPAPDAA